MKNITYVNHFIITCLHNGNLFILQICVIINKLAKSKIRRAKSELVKVKLRGKDIQNLPGIKHELSQKVEIIMQEFSRKLVQYQKKELVIIRNMLFGANKSAQPIVIGNKRQHICDKTV